MSARITLTIKKGAEAGKSFTYEGKESLIIGRQNDCAIVLPESTVSRYHCLIDIAPPSVVVRDFGSLNGTYLNGEKIGQRESGLSAEEAREMRGEEFTLGNGDALGLGKDSALQLEIKLPQFCADCYEEMYDSPHTDPEGLAICPTCFEERKAGREPEEQERQQKEEERKERERKEQEGPRCGVCGGPLNPEGENQVICESCVDDPVKLLLFLMEQAQQGVGDAEEIAGYRNIRMLGQGGMGQVWLVEEEATGKEMALKLMLPKAAVDESSRESFAREAHFACQLNHPNIVQHHRFGQSGDTYFMLLEFCEGGCVDSLIDKRGGTLDIDTATAILFDVLDGLTYAHNATVSVTTKKGKTVSAQGIVHRDFKPGNIFLTGSGSNLTAKVADFGLAKAFETSGLSGHTQTGMLAGTPVFMPRQQIINYKFSKPEVDVWAAAASYYYMLTGSFVKDFKPGKDVIATALTTDAIPIRKRKSSIPRKLAAVIDQALTEKPDIAIKSAAELKRMIERAL